MDAFLVHVAVGADCHISRTVARADRQFDLESTGRAQPNGQLSSQARRSSGRKAYAGGAPGSPASVIVSEGC